jgi:hypothetical protein
MRQEAIRALEIRDETEISRRMTQGELEARALEGERAQAAAPADVSSQLRLTAHAEADHWQQSADAQARNDQAAAANARSLARLLADQRQQLEAAAARYEQWSATTVNIRETAGRAKAELERRGLAQRPEPQHTEPEGETQTTAEWWQQFETDLAGAGRAIEREHQAVVATGNPWPPQRKPQPQPQPAPGGPGTTPEPGNQADPADQALAEAREAAQHFIAERQAREARAQYALRVEREAEAAAPEAGMQAQPREDAEIGL